MTLVHVLSIGFVIAVITMADKEALAWMRGKKSVLDRRSLHNLHVMTWVGLLALIASGVTLFWDRKEYLLTQPLFIMKMLFVAVLVVNGILIGRLMNIALEKPFADLSPKKKVELFASGMISSLSWIGAFILGIILFY